MRRPSSREIPPSLTIYCHLQHPRTMTSSIHSSSVSVLIPSSRDLKLASWTSCTQSTTRVTYITTLQIGRGPPQRLLSWTSRSSSQATSLAPWLTATKWPRTYIPIHYRSTLNSGTVWQTSYFHSCSTWWVAHLSSSPYLPRSIMTYRIRTTLISPISTVAWLGSLSISTLWPRSHSLRRSAFLP